jgi:hypothetical protein
VTSLECLDVYVASWNESDGAKRAALLETAWAADGVYCDPTARVSGRAGLSEHIGNLRASLGEFAIGPTSQYDEHHGFVRWTWRMTKESGEPMLGGLDVARIDDNGQVALIVGFFEEMGGS